MFKIILLLILTIILIYLFIDKNKTTYSISLDQSEDFYHQKRNATINYLKAVYPQGNFDSLNDLELASFIIHYGSIITVLINTKEMIYNHLQEEMIQNGILFHVLQNILYLIHHKDIFIISQHIIVIIFLLFILIQMKQKNIFNYLILVVEDLELLVHIKIIKQDVLVLCG